jgi:hypothetical protein
MNTLTQNDTSPKRHQLWSAGGDYLIAVRTHDLVFDSVWNEVRNQVGNQVGRQARHQTWNQVTLYVNERSDQK